MWCAGDTQKTWETISPPILCIQTINYSKLKQRNLIVPVNVCGVLDMMHFTSWEPVSVSPSVSDEGMLSNMMSVSTRDVYQCTQDQVNAPHSVSTGGTRHIVHHYTGNTVTLHWPAAYQA